MNWNTRYVLGMLLAILEIFLASDSFPGLSQQEMSGRNGAMVYIAIDGRVVSWTEPMVMY